LSKCFATENAQNGSMPDIRLIQTTVKLNDGNTSGESILTAHTHTAMWCKICGITSVADAKFAVDAGVDAIGLNFYANSARVVTPELAAVISTELFHYAPNCARIGLFVNHTESEVRAVLKVVPLDILQFHGAEPPEFCESFNVPFIKVLSMRQGIDFAALDKQYSAAWALLLDTYHPTQAGGTGETFDWQLWPRDSQTRLILAGGLTVENVANAIVQTSPYGVDVSGGVEDGVKGVKQQQLVRRFIKEAKNV
jgi:phosphoribosylanthranilate isomerase